MSDALDLVRAYHQRSKHTLQRYAAGPETLDWDAQPSPWRRYEGAPVVALPLLADGDTTHWADLFTPGAVLPRAPDLAAVALLFELSLALSAWKQQGPDRWALRCNPSSGNLHPTEAYLLAQGVAGLDDGVYHYAPREHALERRAAAAGIGLYLAFTSIHWREAWKYGERAWRYCQLDIGHALGAVRMAAAVLGWGASVVEGRAHAELASRLGLDRDADFGPAEREEPELLIALHPGGVPTGGWAGQANRLDARPMYRWPVIDEVAAATRLQPAVAQAKGPLAATLIRGRRSAQRFDRRHVMSTAAFGAIVQALGSLPPPLDVWPGAPRVHPVLFVNRVDGLAPGAYVLPRSAEGERLLRAALVTGQPWLPTVFTGLWQIAENAALAGTLRTVFCHQALGSDAALAVSLLAEFDSVLEAAPWRYRSLLQEAGLVGHQLYLQAEAVGERATGIGCFFDDALHELLGISGSAVQALYQVTIGQALDDPRVQAEPPYAGRTA